MLAVVEAMPLVVKTALYGAASPVSRSTRSARIVSARSPPRIVSPRKVYSSSLCRVAKCTSS